MLLVTYFNLFISSSKDINVATVVENILDVIRQHINASLQEDSINVLLNL